MYNYEKEAKQFCEAIKTLAANESSLDNLECYLAFHFADWLKRVANTPENIAWEMKEFSKIK